MIRCAMFIVLMVASAQTQDAVGAGGVSQASSVSQCEEIRLKIVYYQAEIVRQQAVVDAAWLRYWAAVRYTRSLNIVTPLDWSRVSAALAAEQSALATWKGEVLWLEMLKSFLRAYQRSQIAAGC